MHILVSSGLVVFLSATAPSCGSAGTVQLSLRSYCTVPEGKPFLLVEQLLLQFNVGRSHKSLLALHYHLQNHPVEDRNRVVLQLWMMGACFSQKADFRMHEKNLWSISLVIVECLSHVPSNLTGNSSNKKDRTRTSSLKVGLSLLRTTLVFLLERCFGSGRRRSTT